MITIRVGKYTAEDSLFVASVINQGLAKNCFNYSPTEKNLQVCDECSTKLGCKELQSAMHHMLAVSYAKQAENLTKENKSLLNI